MDISEKGNMGNKGMYPYFPTPFFQILFSPELDIKYLLYFISFNHPPK